ncbi:MAG: maleylpyruvate isomerase N-terminal domain-containing protein [Acidimicrobiales bacterium]
MIELLLAYLLVAITIDDKRFADLLASAPVETWDAPPLCENWQIRHAIAHMTMPARFTPAQFGTATAAAGGNFTLT